MKSLKVLMLNGSPHTNGNTAVALREMEAIFKENDLSLIHISSPRDCS